MVERSSLGVRGLWWTQIRNDKAPRRVRAEGLGSVVHRASAAGRCDVAK